jgi:hypothetical protein
MTLKATIAIEPLRTALEALEYFQFDVTFHVDAQGLRAGVINDAHTFTAELSFPAEAFRSFEFDGAPLSLPLSLAEFLSLMSAEHGKAELMHLRVRGRSRKLRCRFSKDIAETDHTKGSYVAIPSPVETSYSDAPPLPPTARFEPTFSASSPADFFPKLRAELEKWFEGLDGGPLREVCFNPHRSGAMIIQVNDKAGNSRHRSLDVEALGLVIKPSPQKPPSACYGAHHMRGIRLPELPADQECRFTWEIGTDSPLIATYALNGGARVRFVLGPRIEDKW